MKRWKRRRRVDDGQAAPLTPSQVMAAREKGAKFTWITTLVYIALTGAGSLGMAIALLSVDGDQHRWLGNWAFVLTAVFVGCFVYAWRGDEAIASVVALVVSTIGITLVVSQVSAGISLESFLFAFAVVPYVVVKRQHPMVRAGLSVFVLAAYAVCEFGFPEGSGDAELGADLARQVAQFNRAGAAILLFLVVAVLETSHVRMQRVLEGAARYGELRATTDELTGVFNRRPVISQLSEWAQRGRGNYAIALIDLDHFKTINDEFGHDCGDTVLQAVASTLKSHFRDSDMVSRWGGDEFLVLIPGVRHADLVPILERLRRSISLIQRRCEEHVHTVTVSIGAAMGAMGQTPDECIAAADHALYRAKEEGRNKVVAVGVTEPTHALGRPSPDDLEQWTSSTPNPVG